MRILLVAGFSLVACHWSPYAVGAEPDKDADRAKIDALIWKLADNRFVNRKMAGRELQAIGEKALPALKAAAATSKDFDFGLQVNQTIRDIMLGCRTCKSIGLEMALIDAGESRMGSAGNEQNRRVDEKLHTVKITRPYLMGSYEVTQEEYEKVMKANPSWFAPTGGGRDKLRGLASRRFPVERVTWFDALEFCNRLSKQEGYEPFYKMADVKSEEGSIKSASITVVGGNGFRLPTEAEWEFACRAKSTTRFHFGNYTTGLEANVKAVPATGYGAPPAQPDLGRTTTVGSYKPNALNLFDMHGNVAEWCWDWYDADYYGKAPEDDPQGPTTGTHRTLRGGNWLISNGNCRSASRFFLTPEDRSYYAGFRVVRNP